MKEQFVTYEIALALKELGFDESVISAFLVETKELQIFAFDLTNSRIFTETGFPKGWSVKAPLWQQVIDWLREKHDLFVEVNVLIDGTYSYTISRIEQDGNYAVNIKFEFTELKSYYETRKQLILKAIELCKNN